MEKLLNPQRALIFRIVHRENVRTMLEQGLKCRSSLAAQAPYVQIGNPELIDKRQSRAVDHPLGGCLSDYVPFYFTPFSPMMYNIKTGYNGIQRRDNKDIVIFVSSLHRLAEMSIPFVYTDRHAYLKFARFTADLNNLGTWIDWAVLQSKNFRKDDVDKFERYQAEALVRGHLPPAGLSGLACYDDNVTEEVKKIMAELGYDFLVTTIKGWYF